MKLLKRIAAVVLPLWLAACPTLAPAANLTPDQLTQATTANNTDLFVLYPVHGPMESVQWSVIKSLMTAALGSSYLQVANNLVDVASPSSARFNLGLGTAAVANTGASGTVVPFLNGANQWGAKQTLFVSTTGSAALNCPVGAVPTSPTSGDLWCTSAGMYMDVGGVTVGPFAAGGVTTFNTRTGAVTPASGDYTVSQVTGAAPLASPTFTGTPLVPTATAGTSTTQAASTAFVATSFAPKASPAFTGSTPTSNGTALVLTTDGRFIGPAQNIQCTYTLTLSDAGNQVYCNAAGTHTLTIPANASVAFPVGAKIEIVNYCSAGNLTINITTDSLGWAPSGLSGSRTMAPCSMATLTKIVNTFWIITGVGIT